MFFSDEERFSNAILNRNRLIYSPYHPMPAVGSYTLRGGKFDQLGSPTPSRSINATMDPSFSLSARNKIRTGILHDGIFVCTSRQDQTNPGPGSYNGSIWKDNCTLRRSPRQVISDRPRWSRSDSHAVVRNGVLFLRGDVECHKDEGAAGPGSNYDAKPILWRSFNTRILDGNAPHFSRTFCRSRSFSGSIGLPLRRTLSNPSIISNVDDTKRYSKSPPSKSPRGRSLSSNTSVSSTDFNTRLTCKRQPVAHCSLHKGNSFSPRRNKRHRPHNGHENYISFLRKKCQPRSLSPSRTRYDSPRTRLCRNDSYSMPSQADTPLKFDVVMQPFVSPNELAECTSYVSSSSFVDIEKNDTTGVPISMTKNHNEF